MIVSSTKRRWEISNCIKSELPTENPRIKLDLGAVDNILLNTSITRMKRSGELRSPWRSPLDEEKKSVGEPLTSTAKVTVCLYPPYPFVHKACSLQNIDRNSQFTWSYSFSISSLQITLGFPSLILESTSSLAIKMTSRIWQPRQKSSDYEKSNYQWHWHLSICRRGDKSLYTHSTKLIGH